MSEIFRAVVGMTEQGERTENRTTEPTNVVRDVTRFVWISGTQRSGRSINKEEISMGKLDDYHERWTENDDEYGREHPDDRDFLYDDEIEELEWIRDQEIQQELEDGMFDD